MSLINDALKKAQKMRTQDPGAFAPSVPNGNSGPVARRARPMSARWLAGLAAGAAVLVVGSIFATVFWLRKSAATPALVPAAHATAVSESPAPPIRPVEPAPAPLLAPPAPLVPVTSPAVAGVTAPIAPRAEPPLAAARPVVPVPPLESPPPPPAETAKVPPASEAYAPPVAGPESHPAREARFDARAQAFVDSLHVTGIRASGSDSKVLMNDRVFRLNDIVERALGLRLTGVAADQLVFTDGNGVVYTRNF